MLAREQVDLLRGLLVIGEVGTSPRPEEVQRRYVVPQVDPRFGLRIGQEAEIAERSPGVGHQEAEGGQREVRRDPADTGAEPALQVRARHRAGARHAGEIGVHQIDQILAVDPASPQQSRRPPVLSPPRTFT
jgi:hypothetical protein